MSPLPETSSPPAHQVHPQPVPTAADQTGPRRLYAVPADDPATCKPNPDPDSDSGLEVDDEGIVGSDTRPRGTAGSWLRDAFVPGSGLYADRQPSISESVRRARRGAQLADGGPLRLAATAHGYLAAANKATVITWTWIVDHPARLLVFLGLLGLAVAFPPTRAVLHLLLTPVVWAHQALD